MSSCHSVWLFRAHLLFEILEFFLVLFWAVFGERKLIFGSFCFKNSCLLAHRGLRVNYDRFFGSFSIKLWEFLTLFVLVKVEYHLDFCLQLVVAQTAEDMPSGKFQLLIDKRVVATFFWSGLVF